MSEKDVSESLNAAQFARARLGFHPDAMQERVLDVTIHRGILNCTRQWGKSTVTAVKAVHRAWMQEGCLVLVASPSARQSRLFVRKAAEFVRRLGVRPRGDGDNEISLALPNGSRIVGLPGREDTTRGFSNPALLVIDEAARVPDTIYDGLEPMLATGDGDLWLISTPNGKRGFFWEEWSRGGELWTRISVPATECPRISAEFLEQQRSRKSQRVFRQEYLCEFVESSDAVFSEEDIQAAFSDDVPPLWEDMSWLRR